MQTTIERVEAALSDLRNGNMIILTDDPERENEGDLIIPAETITTEQMNFFLKHTSGIVCLSLTKSHLQDLNLPLMVPSADNTSLRGTPFTISIDSTYGITTGVSAADRVKTIRDAIANNAKPDDLVKPGHIFPLQANDDGVFARQGHTEGAIDLARLAGFKPAAVLCEIMNPDGTMTHGKQLDVFAEEHQLKIISIDDIITYRLQHENLIAEQVSTELPIDQYGTFNLTVVKEKVTDKTHMIFTKGNMDANERPLVRIHSSCVTGDLFSSQRCDCHQQLHHALRRISTTGGVLIYLDQEGRGIGLLNKIKAYALQDQGFDTVEANQALGLPVDPRDYAAAACMLRNLGLNRIRLLTNNPAKVANLAKYGFHDVEQETLPAFDNEHNHHYLMTKKTKLNHAINLDVITDIKRVS